MHDVHADRTWPPVAQALRAKAEAIRSSELERTMSRLPDSLSKKERRAVEDCTKSIVNKLLHGCMASLRCDGSDSAVGPADLCCSPWRFGNCGSLQNLPPRSIIMLIVSSRAPHMPHTAFQSQHFSSLRVQG
jgi:Glutamyl-tRNAGlu reductase, dimerisation domain